ncbi:hypothetical protein AYI68_g5869 [Smittium mucronatum]|uniref:Uncharacterized protein n=1 Tax=Smittium mucronatum TaxID=133383 RepID=A0A1R0GT20_9FUNG|nr:hypothetical protein AYI68_g5869 [Smittium mucronatum]
MNNKYLDERKVKKYIIELVSELPRTRKSSISQLSRALRTSWFCWLEEEGEEEDSCGEGGDLRALWAITHLMVDATRCLRSLILT